MKTKIILLLLALLPILTFAQNYEQQGDTQYSQSQYEKAAKSYKAAIELTGETPVLKQKIANCTKCQSLLVKAQNAENTAKEPADFDRASQCYTDLYTVHPLQTYKDKANTLKAKADAIRKQRQQARQAAEAIDEDAVYVVVDQAPVFQGGNAALFQYISDNIQYPATAKEKGIKGRVICQVVVNKDGSVTDVNVVQSSGDASLDDEAIRVLQSMPKWTPGKKNGRPVNVKYTIPVNFKL